MPFLFSSLPSENKFKTLQETQQYPFLQELKKKKFTSIIIIRICFFFFLFSGKIRRIQYFSLIYSCEEIETFQNYDLVENKSAIRSCEIARRGAKKKELGENKYS